MNSLNEKQNKVVNTFKKGKSNIVVRATAGSGKTTVLKACSDQISKIKKSIFLAFNNSIVDELKEKLPKHIKVSTLHSCGISFLYRYYGTIQVDPLKTTRFTKKHFKALDITIKKQDFFNYRVSQLYDFCRMSMLKDYSVENIVDVADKYGVDIDAKVIELLIRTQKDISKYNAKSNHKKFNVDYVDMVYLPASNQKISVTKYDYVMVDEAQDMSACDISLVERLIKPKTGRTVFVGDPNQMIYLFAGSDSKAYDKMLKRENTVELPLSVTYRCAQNIVDEARKIYPVIESAPNAVEGKVKTGSWTDIKEGDLVVCRNNDPLIILCADLIEKGLKASVYKNEMEKPLKVFLRKYKDFQVHRIEQKMWDELNQIEDRLISRGVKNPKKHRNYEKIENRNKVIEKLIKKFSSTREIINRVEQIFDDKQEGVRLMSIHSSKGLEADRVFFLKPKLIPSKFAKTDEELKQEQNLKFVAITRAKKELIYI